MRILVIDGCNFIDYPTGGQLSFIRNLLNAFKATNELILIGGTTDDETPVGEWAKKEINGKLYDFFAYSKYEKQTKKPFIPGRLTSYLNFRHYCTKALDCEYDYIIVQTPEILLNLPDSVLDKVLLSMPGVKNPLSISRYPFAKHLQGIFDYFFFKKAVKVHKVFAAADAAEINDFVRRSKGGLKVEDVEPYPTRYDDSVFFVGDKFQSRKRLKIDPEVKTVITIGRLNWFKGWKMMLDSFSIYKNEYPNSHFIFIGDGEDEPKIKEYVRKQHLEAQVFFAGRKLPSEVAEYLNAADLFVMASFAEGWSTTLVEACACGVPCVVTNFSSSEMIEDSENGFVVTNRDEEEFASKMVEALQIPREQVVTFNKKFESLSISHMRDSILKLI